MVQSGPGAQLGLPARIQNRVRGVYERLVQASCSEQPFPIPSCVQRYFNNAYSFEYVSAIRRFVAESQRVLIIGDGGGRDYFSLRLIGKRPVVMDIAQQALIPDFVIADANAPLPFAPASFDAVVMAEVLEHLPEDFRALRQVRDIVKEGGFLVLTVPYYHDAEPTHVRIHSPESIERLLRAAGWHVVSYIEKGGGLCRLAGWFPLRMAFHAGNWIAYQLRGKTFYQVVNRHVATFDFRMGRRRNSLHRHSKLYGAFLQCVKAEAANWSAMNVMSFENMHTRLVR